VTVNDTKINLGSSGRARPVGPRPPQRDHFADLHDRKVPSRLAGDLRLLDNDEFYGLWSALGRTEPFIKSPILEQRNVETQRKR
jgi:hypothetical protein